MTFDDPQPTGIRCDNYPTCKSKVHWHGSYDATYAVARIRGWHIFEGLTLGGSELKAVLCNNCVGTNRSQLPPAPKVLPGQLELPLEGHNDEEGTDPDLPAVRRV